ncbi:hypothetical protein Fmac_021078 [Flemingia macrophylla]|uniref:UBA domain-containing protein n=1 Tax=Flemingia macrophylla TaxID=520843 RepID=A0ABD1LW03_9FABA
MTALTSRPSPLSLSCPSPPIPLRPPPESHRDNHPESHPESHYHSDVCDSDNLWPLTFFPVGVVIFQDVFDNAYDVGGAQIKIEGVYIWPFRQLRMVANRPSSVELFGGVGFEAIEATFYVVTVMVLNMCGKEGELNLNEDYILSNPYHLASSSAVLANSKVLDHFVGMGFSREMVSKVIQEYGEENEAKLLEELLTYTDIEKNISDSENDDTLRTLVKMGYKQEEALIAIERLVLQWMACEGCEQRLQATKKLGKGGRGPKMRGKPKKLEGEKHIIACILRLAPQRQLVAPQRFQMAPESPQKGSKTRDMTKIIRICHVDPRVGAIGPDFCRLRDRP